MSVSFKLFALIFTCLLLGDVCYQCIRYAHPLDTYLDSGSSGGNAAGLGYNILEEEPYHPTAENFPAIKVTLDDLIRVLFSDQKGFNSISCLEGPEIPPESIA